MSRKLSYILLLLTIAGVAHARIETAVPTAISRQVLDVNSVSTFVPAKLDLARLGEEDLLRDQLGLPPRFAIPEKVALSPAHQGTWEDLGDGRLLWRLRILGREGTTSLNLGFTRFKLTRNARLMLYSTDGSQVQRPFTAADNEKHGQLWTPVLLTNDLIVELTVPSREARRIRLEIGSVNQGYRGFGTVSADAYAKSGSCNLDVECLDSADTWRDEMRAVGVISTGGSTFCTGSLVNNTANDTKMYFITANHCGISSSNAASLVVYWNYQNSFCRAPGSAASGQPGDGLLNQFHTGSFFRASSSASDFTLVELDDPPVAAYNHYWAGWDRSTGSHVCSSSSPCTSIHHPSTDEKRITYVTSTMESTSYGGTTSPGNGTHLWAKWATDPPGPYTVPGVTEPGSSGSPLYNSAGHFVGQLHGGPSSCGATGNNLSDYYGRFSVSWTGGGTNSTRLSNWLDPNSTGVTVLTGLDSASACGNSFVNQVPVMTSNTAPSGTITASGIFSSSYPAWHAFDASNSTMWLSETFGSPAWIAYEWNTSQYVYRYSLTYSNGSITTRAPKDWQLQGWNGTSWVTVDSRSNETGWAGLETRSYLVASPGSYTRYRLYITDDNDSRSGVVVISLGKVALEGCSCVISSSQVPVMTSNTAPSGAVTTSGVFSTSYPAWHAFDGANSTLWLSETFETPAWIAYSWGSGRFIETYDLVYTNGSITSRAPKDWQLQGWNGSAWVIVDARSNQVGWSGNETRSFTVANPGTYTQYRLLISDDNDSRTGVVVISLGRVILNGCPN